jgi:hypothetical protein
MAHVYRHRSTQHIDVVKVLLEDPQTQGIVLIGEIGGTMEEEAAAYLEQFNKTRSNPKPVVSLPVLPLLPAGGWVTLVPSSREEREPLPPRSRRSKRPVPGSPLLPLRSVT